VESRQLLLDSLLDGRRSFTLTKHRGSSCCRFRLHGECFASLWPTFFFYLRLLNWSLCRSHLFKPVIKRANQTIMCCFLFLFLFGDLLLVVRIFFLHAKRRLNHFWGHFMALRDLRPSFLLLDLLRVDDLWFLLLNFQLHESLNRHLGVLLHVQDRVSLRPLVEQRTARVLQKVISHLLRTFDVVNAEFVAEQSVYTCMTMVKQLCE